MKITLVRQKINNALYCFYTKHANIIPHWRTSKCYITAFARILEKEFVSWDIDCYFVHYNQSNIPFFDDLECDIYNHGKSEKI